MDAHVDHKEPDRPLQDADAATVVESWSIKSTLIMWTVWARVTCGQARRAREARRAFEQAHGGPEGTLVSRALGEEMEAAVVAIRAAAFAVEAIVRSLAASPIATTRPGKESHADRVARLIAASLTDATTATALADRWRPIITTRHKAVHFNERARDLDLHPSRLAQTAVEARTFNAKRALEAAQVLIDTLEALRDHPVPEITGALTDPSAVIEEIRQILRP